MKHGTIFLIFLSLLLALVPVNLRGQTSTGTELKSTQFDTTGFPTWVRDLRRAEIVAFGSFPFTFFFASFAMDTYRYVSHDRNRLYAPWPLKPAGAIEMSQREVAITLSAAAAGSVLISLADYLIVKYKQNKRQRELDRLTGESPIILRSRLPEGEETGEGGGASPEESPPFGEGPPVPVELSESGDLSSPGTVPEMP
jgi:hypothetical protein